MGHGFSGQHCADDNGALDACTVNRGCNISAKRGMEMRFWLVEDGRKYFEVYWKFFMGNGESVGILEFVILG